MLKRAFLKVRRQPGKSIILGIVLFVIANLVIAGLSIANATKESMDYAKESLGSEVSLTANMESMRKSMEEGTTDTESYRDQLKEMERPEPNISDVLKIADSDYVADFTYGYTVRAEASDFTPIETTDDKRGPGGMKSQDSETDDTNTVSINSINAYNYITGVSDKTFELKEGDTFDEDSTDALLVSYDLAKANNWSVGSSVKLKNTYTSEEVTMKITGIYESNTDDFLSNSNVMYTNIELGKKFLEGDLTTVTNVTYYLNNPEDSEKFIEDANKLVSDLEENNLTLAVDNQAYEQRVGPIEQVGSTASIILVVVILAAIVIISLIIIIQIKERNYEIGVLLSLGETKLKIVIQLFTELFIIASVAFVLSIFSGSLISKQLGTSLLNSQLELQETQENTTMGGPREMVEKPSKSNNQVEVIDHIDVNVGLTDYLKLFLIGYVIIGVSIVLPMFQIMRYEPKKILQRNEG